MILCHASESAKSSDKDFDRVEEFYKQTTLDCNQFWTKHYGLKNTCQQIHWKIHKQECFDVTFAIGSIRVGKIA